MTGIRMVRCDSLAGTTQTPGMQRSAAFAEGAVWAGSVQMEAGAASGWHHHGINDSYLYVVSGKARFEYGEEGRQAVDAQTGDFVFIPAHTVHREVNPGAESSSVVLFRVGGGEPVFNVDGPEARS